jgi:hypothetical protein
LLAVSERAQATVAAQKPAPVIDAQGKKTSRARSRDARWHGLGRSCACRRTCRPCRTRGHCACAGFHSAAAGRTDAAASGAGDPDRTAAASAAPSAAACHNAATASAATRRSAAAASGAACRSAAAGAGSGAGADAAFGRGRATADA